MTERTDALPKLPSHCIRPSRPHPTFPHARSSWSARGGSGCGAKGLSRCVALLSEVDLSGGMEGGLGLIELAACCHGFHILRRFHDLAIDGISTEQGSGLVELVSRARRHAFDVVIISEPDSLGNTPAEVRRTFSMLSRFDVDVYAGRLGRLSATDLT